MNYKYYITSAVWRKKRQEFIAKKFYGKCMCCGGVVNERNLNIHHLRYNTLGRERLNDLVAVCVPCHKAIHFENGLKLENTDHVLAGRFFKMRKQLQNLHAKPIRNDQYAKMKRSVIRKKHKDLKHKIIKKQEENKSNPKYDTVNKKFIYTPYVNSKKLRTADLIKINGLKIVKKVLS